MSQFVDSLYRLYREFRISKQMVDNLLFGKKINQQEYDYIISSRREE